MAVIEAVKRSSKLREWTEVVTLTEEPDPNPVLSAAVRRSTIAAVWSLFPNEFYLQFQEEQIDSFLKILTPSWRNLNKKAVLSWRFVMTFCYDIYLFHVTSVLQKINTKRTINYCISMNRDDKCLLQNRMISFFETWPISWTTSRKICCSTHLLTSYRTLGRIRYKTWIGLDLLLWKRQKCLLAVW